MKKVTITFVILLIFSISAYAETGTQGSQQGQMGQGMMMGQGQQMPMNCPKMQQMHGQGMMQGGQQMPMAHDGARYDDAGDDADDDGRYEHAGTDH